MDINLHPGRRNVGPCLPAVLMVAQLIEPALKRVQHPVAAIE